MTSYRVGNYHVGQCNNIPVHHHITLPTEGEIAMESLREKFDKPLTVMYDKRTVIMYIGTSAISNNEGAEAAPEGYRFLGCVGSIAIWTPKHENALKRILRERKVASMIRKEQRGI